GRQGEVQTRIRLAESQIVVVLAQLSDGSLRRANAEIRVTTGGCLT
ncbi:MAG: sulfur oxidation protein SoxY, partial [Alphaproteobacteria bacterium]|nr:sulfur oxidation protein SoxY [Alphaproteobacteria bacterium]